MQLYKIVKLVYQNAPQFRSIRGLKIRFQTPASVLKTTFATRSRGRPRVGRAHRVAAVRRRRPALSSQKGENAGTHTLTRSLTLSLTHSLALPLSLT